MKSLLRTLLALAPLPAAAHCAVVLSFGTPAGAPLTVFAAPAVGSSATIAVFYTSTTPILDGGLLVAFDRSTTQGPAATRLDQAVALTLPAAAPGVALTNPRFAGGADSTLAPAGTARPYGLDVPGVAASSGLLPATATPLRLFDVPLSNLTLAPGSSYVLSFYTGGAGLYTSAFLDDAGDEVATTGTTLLVSAAPVPEPASLAALGLGALGLLRRRRA